MGLLLKIILFGLVFYYIFKTIGGIVYRLMGGQVNQNPSRRTPPTRKEGEINIDYTPKDQKKRSGSGSKEGDYIDYEEIK